MPAARMRTLLFGAALVALACSPGPEPCVSPGTCARGDECLANRCVPAGGAPVPAHAQRLVFEPKAIAVLSSRGHRAGAPLSGAAVFGSRAAGAAALYLRFARPKVSAPRIAGAFVLLEPMPAAPISRADVVVRAWRVGQHWSPAELSWLRQPRRSLPRSSGIARASPPSELRIDVTDIERFVATPGRNDWGIVLQAAAGDGFGVTYSTGVHGAPAPRLELYVR